jgi:phosphatidate cytidylyltransferase
MDSIDLNFIAVLTLVELFFILGAIVTHLVNRGKPAETQKLAWTKFWVYFALVNFLMFIFKYNQTLTYYVVLGIVLLGVREYVNVVKRIRSWKIILALSIPFFIVVATPILFPLWIINAFELYVAVIIFDGFSQIIGQLVKGPKLIPAISPNKTVSGFLGATIMLFVSEYVFFHQPHALIYSLVVAVVSLVGDLFASYIKRKAGVKDYSALLPGHGGFLDRFDSLLMVLTVYSISHLLFS